MVLPIVVHPADRALSDRPRPLLDDDEPLDGRAGARHAAAGAEAGGAAEDGRRSKTPPKPRRRTATATARSRAARPRAEADRPAAGRAQEEEAGAAVTEDAVRRGDGRDGRRGEVGGAARARAAAARDRQDRGAVRGGHRGRARPARRRLRAGARRRDRRRADVRRAAAEPPPDESELAARRALARRADRRRARRALPGRRPRGRRRRARRVRAAARSGVLIGRYGQTIDAVQYLVNAIVARREGERVEVTVDAAGYRERRREMLERLALRSAERARETRRAGRARADDGGRAQGRPPASEGGRRRRDVERGHGAEPLRRRQPHLSAGSGPSSRRPG